MGKKIVIIGGVAGGATTAARMRRLDESAEIIMFERGAYISFANCGLPYYIGGVIQNRSSLIVQTEADMESKFALDIRTEHEVLAIDRAAKNVTVKNLVTEETFAQPYDFLVISTGAFPVKPPISGIKEAKNLFTLRTIPDTDAIKTFIETEHPKTAVVIGGGFIGLEMAENLRALSMNVTVVEMADQVMAPIDFEMASIVHQHLIENGITLILKDGVKAFENEGARIVLASGTVLEADLIIFSIGVKPENGLAKAAGLALGDRGGIKVNEYLQTSDPIIYAIGDAVEIEDYIHKKPAMIALAGPANKQGRIVADNIDGRQESYQGSLATAVAKVFELSVASTGANEKTLKALGLKYQAIHTHPGSHAGYYPGASRISLKILYHPENGAIYGAQAIGVEGADKRIDVIATAIFAHLTISDLKDLDLAYAPPYSSAKDPVNMLGFVSDNLKTGAVATVQWHEIDALTASGEYLLDVREQAECELGVIRGSVNIPFASIRERMAEIPKDKTINVYCQSGIRAYSTARILQQNGYTVRNLDGGYLTYQCATAPCINPTGRAELDDSGKLITEPKTEGVPTMETITKKISVNACGLQCPGPIVELYKALQTMKDGDVLEVTATDPGFFKDVKAWTEKTGNTLLDVKIEKKIVTAVIKKGGIDLAKNKDVVVSQGKENTTIVVFSQDLDKAIAAFIIATGAASMGKKVSLFFTFWGLNILRKPKHVKVAKNFIEKMFGFMMPRGVNRLPISNMNMLGMGPMMIKGIMKKKNVDSLNTLMANALQMGVKIQACAMSMDIMGIKQEELIDGIEVVGVATYLADTTEANHNLFI
jgi:NADPH-dependent 2,4-dienoyl-CoA reductase/sulfur reductase-like enzyme/peroxiredoxin family protein/TusA-related sulfurtransferase/rhodanese-related sulfurtransferase